MSNRFHNKYHRHNHHTAPTSIDVDSALDPIASPEFPYLGEFHLSGDLVVLDDYSISASSAIVADISGNSIVANEIYVDALNSQSGSAISADNNIDIGSNIIANLTLDKLTNVVISTPTAGQFLYYDGNNWINSSLGVALRPRYVSFTSGSLPLNVQINGTYTYNIDEFDGSGIDTDNIYEIYIQCYIRTDPDGGDAYIAASFPNAPDILVKIFQLGQSKRKYGDRRHDIGVVTVPINSGQKDITIELHSVTCDGYFEILGGMQFGS